MKINIKVDLFWKIFIAVALVVIVVILGLRFFSGDEDTWLCQTGGWVKHGKPIATMPTTPCGQPNNSFVATTTMPTEIEVFTPLSGETISSPLIVEGQAIGNWFFEASFPVELIDDQGKILGRSYVQAQSDWMTENFVSFKGEINYEAVATTTGKLILKNDNPSGLAQNDKKIEIPVLISPNQIMTVRAFFSNNNLDSEVTCTKVFFVDRRVVKTVSAARVALEQLLAGPSEQEKFQGFYTSINSGVVIQKLTIADGVAKVDFNETMENGMGGSCRVGAIRAQITETLKQFSTIKDVIISINGRTDDILQP